MEGDRYGFRLDHVGMNAANGERAHEFAGRLCALFGWNKEEKSSSVFAGTGVEVMKAPYRGENGHIAVATCDIEGAVEALSAQGVAFDEATAKRDSNGRLKAIYLAEPIGGFAVHLVQRA
jgi:2-dehydro-3-deoxyphosphogluconate aldolase/(4S)-4-hydroxy-2-oxoglutarate aldolase